MKSYQMFSLIMWYEVNEEAILKCTTKSYLHCIFMNYVSVSQTFTFPGLPLTLTDSD